MSYTIYLDESCQTGADLLNKEQTHLVYSGILIDDNDYKNIIDYINNNTKIKRGIEKRQLFFEKEDGINLFNEISKYKNSKLYATIVNKKYIVSNYVISTFFNFTEFFNFINFMKLFNFRNFINMNIEDLEIKLKKLQDDMSEYSHNHLSANINDNSIIENFYEQIRNNNLSLDMLEDIKLILLKIFSNKDMHSYINNINTQDILNKSLNMKNNNILNPNNFMHDILLDFLIKVNKYNSNINIVHDQRSDIKKVFDNLKNNYYQYIKNINPNFIVADSKFEILIQFADLSCRFIRKQFDNNIIKDEIKKLICKHFFKMIVLYNFVFYFV
ncbi:DUF3800 domain-containing protein [Brachyspira hyodysenteriae]|uniref:DUF3800 domain-containing protein n=3 Tax=Brachyspira hyodysenteriae TaxID=159 RepID=UPI0022CDD44A|nr:DUF3800 domain-containing protein [Brachyspira hyodysenteriae]MCZ9939230.1 hypothetical protein [Brachyspira hyodysenteriae]